MRIATKNLVSHSVDPRGVLHQQPSASKTSLCHHPNPTKPRDYQMRTASVLLIINLVMAGCITPSDEPDLRYRLNQCFRHEEYLTQALAESFLYIQYLKNYVDQCHQRDQFQGNEIRLLDPELHPW